MAESSSNLQCKITSVEGGMCSACCCCFFIHVVVFFVVVFQIKKT